MLHGWHRNTEVNAENRLLAITKGDLPPVLGGEILLLLFSYCIEQENIKVRLIELFSIFSSFDRWKW